MSTNQQADLQNTAQSIMDIIKNQQTLDKVLAMQKILDIYDVSITIAGEKQTINNQLILSELPNVSYTKTLAKNETWRHHIRQVCHMKSVDREKLVGAMDAIFMLYMVPHRRKRVTEYINGLKNDMATTELIPSKQKTKRFFGMM